MNFSMTRARAIRYRDAGVDIDAAAEVVRYVKRLAPRTFTPNVLTAIGAFGAGFRLRGWKNPVLVSSTDGVGTKLKVAVMAGRHDTVGEDLVNHCVNDIAVHGAQPLFFMDYFATGKLQVDVAQQVLSGVVRGCKANGCALIGGELAEMPGLYPPGEYDLAGFIVGAVERHRLITGEQVRAGDLLIGLPSSGLHTNGYSLARHLIFEVAGYKIDSYVPELGCTVAEELLRVHRSYLRPLVALSKQRLLKAAAHITGGGITDNLPRVLPAGLAARINTRSWSPPAVFAFLKQLGNIPDEDYRRTFNLGIGMILVLDPKQWPRARKLLDKMRESYSEIGEVVRQPRRTKQRVIYEE